MRRVCGLLLLACFSTAWADTIPTPKDFLGHDVCEDYYLANYSQLTDYWKLLAKKSDRLSVVSIGKTEEGRDQLMCIITDPSNRRHLEDVRKGNERLARARDFKNDDEARNFVKNQKAVVWIDGGLHATETLETQHLIEMAYRLTSQNDPETRRILKDCVILLVHANPDGQDLVSNWYMRKSDPKTRSLAGLPELYEKYCGHDNNRDFYANNIAETRNMNRVLYSEWYPQIVYNHHQSAPSGTIMFCPPFRNPFNYNMDPMVEIATDLVGTHLHQRLIAEGKPGTAMRNSTLYSTWWNGGLRTTTYFHNMVGILTETWGSPNPAPLPFVEKFQIPSTDVPLPVEGGKMWHFRDSLEYEISGNYAILDYASRYRERVLFDFYKAGRNSIDRGSKDTWSRYPSRIAKYGQEALTKPELRDARYYVISKYQPDFATATKFVEKLMQCGIEVDRLKDFAGPWAKGSFVIRCDQAFRPHILDMFEPQDHPNDFQYPGGPPIPPYDNAGYTLAFQMGVKFDRVPVPARFDTEKVELGHLGNDASVTTGTTQIQVDLTQNDAFTVANRAWKAGLTVKESSTRIRVDGTSNQLNDLLKGIPNLKVSTYPLEGDFQVKRKPRIGLWDRYGGSIESGWTRYVLEKFGFDFTVVYPPDLDFGSLRDQFDVLILPDGAVPRDGGRGGGNNDRLADDDTIPFRYRMRMGGFSETTENRLKEFVEKGGHILCIGDSGLNLADRLKLPVKSALVDKSGKSLANTDFYIPGSILTMKLEPGELTRGLEEHVDVFFDHSPSFKVEGDAKAVGTYDFQEPLRSGWAWGQEHLYRSVGIADVPVGEGRVVLFGPEILFRAQSHGTFKLLMNGIFRAAPTG
ncbi:MAG: peptidase [Armatimonadetes bacterium]|nr:peptidase [Armatimonadota bacterium]